MQDRKESDLFIAIRENNTAGIKRLITAGESLSALNQDNQTPIQLAAALNKWDCVEAIAASKKADETDTFKYGEVLLTAMKADRPTSEIRLLVEAGADLSLKTKFKECDYTAIQIARSLVKWDWVEMIAKSRKEDNDKYKFGDALIIAISSEKFDVTKVLIEAGAATTWYTINDENRALHWAVKFKNIELIQALLKSGASIAATNKDKQTPLQLAVTLGFWDCVEVIVKNKKTDEKDSGNYTDVLFSAIKANRPAAEISLLVKAGADLSRENADKETPIQAARTLNQWEQVEAIAKAKKVGEKDIDKYGSVLLTACRDEKVDTVKCLLQAGASTTWHTLDDLNKSLHWAVKKRNIAMINMLLEHGASLTAKNKEGYTPIQLASTLEYWDCVEAIAKNKDAVENDNSGDALRRAVIADQLNTVDILLKAKTPVTWRTTATENYCLHEAVNKNNPKMIALLLKYNADLTSINKNEQTAVELACISYFWDCAQALLQNKEFKFGNSTKAGLAFNKAIQGGRLDIAQSLLDAGASATEKTEGNYALHWTILGRNPKPIQFLLGVGASQTALTQYDKTPIELACETSAWDCAQALLESVNIDPKNKKLIADLHYENALLSAIRNGNYAIARLLLENHAPCTRWNSDNGNIALHLVIATKDSNPDLITLLLDHGADPLIKNKSGHTSLDIAKKMGREDCLLRLQSKNNKKKHRKDTPTLVTQASELYESLVENKVSIKNMASTLDKLDKYHRDIFDNDLQELKTRRDVIRNALPTQIEFMHMAMNPASELGEIMALITLLQSLDSQPVSPMQIDYLQHISSPTARHVLDYLERKQKIDEFTAKIVKRLDYLHTKTNNNKWQVKNALGNWKDGVPSHIEQMKKSLAKRTHASSRNMQLSVYAEIKAILAGISESDRRHPDTATFYDQELNEIKAIKFFTPVANNSIVFQSVPAQPVTAPPNLYLVPHAAMLPAQQAAAYTPSLHEQPAPSFPEQPAPGYAHPSFPVLSWLMENGSQHGVPCPAVVPSAPPAIVTPEQQPAIDVQPQNEGTLVVIDNDEALKKLLPDVPATPLPVVSNMGMFAQSAAPAKKVTPVAVSKMEPA